MNQLNDFPKLLACVAFAGLIAGFGATALAQDRIFRCGNEYTNSPTAAQLPNCRELRDANVTIVQSPRLPVAAAPRTTASGVASNSGARANDTTEQRARDSDSRVILDAELRKAEERLADLKRDYNGGEPEKRGEEFRNNQKYLDRLAEMKANMSRAEADIAGLKREISRLPGSASMGAVPISAGVAAPR